MVVLSLFGQRRGGMDVRWLIVWAEGMCDDGLVRVILEDQLPLL